MASARQVLFAGLAFAILITTACAPESTRTRGGGPGGDVGNRQATLEVHGPISIYDRTPALGPVLGR